MLLKKINALLVLGLIISNVNAGTMGAATNEFIKGFYIEGNVGYANHPWINDRTTTQGLENQLGVLTNLSNMNGGVIGGVDGGLQLNRYFAVEGGWSYIPRASYNRIRTVTMTVGQTTFVLPQGLQVNINSGLGYIAVKGNAPICDRLDAFGKLGAAYAYNNTNVPIPASLVNSPTVYTTQHSNFWNALFAFGLEYDIWNNFTINVQYDYVPGFDEASANHFITPPIQLVTFGLGYNFYL